MNNSEQQYYIDVIRNLIPYTYKYAGVAIYVLSIFSNLTSIFVFLKKSWSKNVCGFYLICYLLWSSLFMTAWMLADILKYSMRVPLHESINIICQIYQYVFYLCGTLVVNVLVFASIDRLLLSSQNVDARLYSSKRLAYFSLGVSSSLWSIYYLHIFIKSSIQQMPLIGIACTFDQSEPYLSFTYYSLAVTNFLGCLSIAILVLLSFKNVRSIRRLSRHQRERQIRIMKKKDFELLRCLCVIDIIYTFFSMLSLIYNIFYELYGRVERTLLDQAIYYFLGRLFTLLNLIPYGSCFWIFLIVSKAFRREIRRIFCKKLMHLGEYENNEEINIFVSNSRG